MSIPIRPSESVVDVDLELRHADRGYCSCRSDEPVKDSLFRRSMLWFSLVLLVAVLLLTLFGWSSAGAAQSKPLPKGWETFLEICAHEQPRPGIGYVNVHSWATPNWKQVANSSYLGGCGMTISNFRDIRLKNWPKTMNLLSPADQIRACYRLYWKYAKIGEAMFGSYEAGQRYASTVWDVHTAMNFHGFLRDKETWQ